MTLEELLMVVNESTMIDIVDADTGEVYIHGDASEMKSNAMPGFDEAEVMDVNCYGSRLTICIDMGFEDWDEDAEEDLFQNPDTVDGWIQQDVIDMYRRER